MCATCGCAAGAGFLTSQVHPARRDASIPHGSHPATQRYRHHVPPGLAGPVGRESTQRIEITLGERVLARNDAIAAANRLWFGERRILALNLMSSPGAGKTTLLERTVRDLCLEWRINVIEGDQATSIDAERVRAAGARAVQVNTGAGCHLDARMIADALPELGPPSGSMLLIENVGNLVCPAMFDLGERAKVLIASVTEGDDKPLKYPHMFRAAHLLLVNKIDLSPYVRFDVERCIANARRINPGIEALAVSAATGEGLPRWYAWLASQMDAGSYDRANIPAVEGPDIQGATP